MKRVIAIAAIGGLALLVAVPLIAQDQPEMTNDQQKDWLVQLLEGQLSTPERQIRISNIDGVLSEDATIRQITISDSEGVWLRVNNAAINWNQRALFVGRLDIRTLSADSIEVVRAPVPSTQASLPSPEAGGLEIPQLPIAIVLQQLSVPSVTFGEQLFGLGSEVSVTGGFTLADGNLDANLDVQRLDGPGGSLATTVKYTRVDANIDLDLTLTEPPNGIMANLLNIEGRPEMALSVSGSGPVTELRTEMTLDAGGQRALTGAATINQKSGGIAITADLHGPISTLMAEQYRPFFGDETALSAYAVLRTQGGVDVPAFHVSGGQITIDGRAQTTPDNFLRLLEIDASIKDPTGADVILPVPGAQTRIANAQFSVDFGTAGNDDWDARLDVAGIKTAGFAANTMNLNASGVAANLDQPEARRVTFNGDGAVAGITMKDPGAQAALGDSVGLGFAGLWNAGEPLQLAEFRILGKSLELALNGTVADAVFDGTIAMNSSSLAPFSEIAGRDLSGAVDLTANGTVSPLSGGFNLTLDGTANDLSISDDALDSVLAGQVSLSGRVARTGQGLEAEGFRLANDQVQITADGTFATGAADFRFEAALADLGLLTPDASGALTITGTAKGKDGPIAVNAEARIPAGDLAGRPLRDALVAFNGTINADIFNADLTGSAFLDGYRVDLASNFVNDPEGRHLNGLKFVAGGTTLTGALSQNTAGLIDGSVKLDASDISTAAALALIDASGSANAAVDFAIVDGKQSANITGTVRNLATEGVKVGSADINAAVADLFGVPMIDGSVTGANIAAGGVDVANLVASANRSGDTTSFDGTAALANGTNVAIAGALSPLADGYKLALDRAVLTQGQLSARLAAPTALTIAGDNVTLSDVRFDVGGGRVTASGSAGKNLDIALTVDALPLSIANAISPGLGLGGTLHGTARIGGTSAAPTATYQVTGSGIAANSIASFGITPLSFSANGSFANNTVTLASLSAQGAGGLSISGAGTIPLSGNGLNVRATGSAPLALANQFVANRGGQFSGTLNLDATVTGSLSQPRFGGSVTTAGAGYIDPELNLRLTDIAANVSLTSDRATINSISANLATGGSINGSGTVGLTGNLPANLTLNLNSARYADGTMLVATVSGRLAVTGALLQSPLVSGNITVEGADITIPDRFGGATLIAVDHVDPPPPVVQTLKRAGLDEAPIPQMRPSIVQLDITVNAPNQIFLRGKGLDAEVGGSVRLTGPVTNVQPIGGFDLIRGRLVILDQRIVFESGSVTLQGNLDPFVNLVASTEGDGITVYVTVSGRVSEPTITFSSIPQLPQDEVLSRLIFKRSMGELSPLQLARLAGAAASLAGGGGSSLTDSLREAAGLADLDIVTDAQGNVALQAGQYLQDNIYLGVTAGANGQSRVTVNLDITNDLKAKASVGVDGNTDIGVFYEKDY